MADATIVITTRNRRAELRTALASATAQRNADIEVLVLDDGSTDGTGDMVRSEFPTVRLERSDANAGLIAARNEAARRARGAVVVSIDDDAEFSDPDTVAQTLQAFAHPRVGAVAMPHIHTRLAPEDERDRAPETTGVWCTWTFIGTAHALRRELFNELGGYREEFHTRNEEPDLCVRMLGRGRVCRLGTTPPVLHHESPTRDRPRVHRMAARNELLEAWRNTPGRALPGRLAAVTANSLRIAAEVHQPRAVVGGLAAGVGAIARDRRREPLAPGPYRAAKLLMRERAVALAAIEPLLPPL